MWKWILMVAGGGVGFLLTRKSKKTPAKIGGPAGGASLGFLIGWLLEKHRAGANDAKMLPEYAPVGGDDYEEYYGTRPGSGAGYESQNSALERQRQEQYSALLRQRQAARTSTPTPQQQSPQALAAAAAKREASTARTMMTGSRTMNEGMFRGAYGN